MSVDARRGLRRWLWPTALLTVGCAGIGAGLLLGGTTVSPTARPSQPPPTTSVRAQVLNDTAAVDCIVHRDTATVPTPTPAEGSSSIVTGRTPGEAATQDGSVLIEISGRPLIVLTGPHPLYRPLTEGDTGEDVAMLQRALARVQPGLVADGEFGRRTSLALSKLYSANGYRPPLAPATTADPEPPQAASQDRTLAENLPRASTRTVTALPGELLFVPSTPLLLATVLPDVGTRLGDELLRYVSGPPQALCTSARLGELTQGKLLTFRDSDMTGTVEEFREVTGEEASATTRQVRVALSGAPAAIGEGTVLRRHVLMATTTDPVLTVPVACLNGGGTTPSVLALRGEVKATIPVTVGLVVDGFAQVTPHEPGGLTDGDVVVVGR